MHMAPETTRSGDVSRSACRQQQPVEHSHAARQRGATGKQVSACVGAFHRLFPAAELFFCFTLFFLLQPAVFQGADFQLAEHRG